MLGPIFIEEVRNAAETVESDIASGPITPNVKPEEIQSYLASRYDFRKEVSLDEVYSGVDFD